MLFLCGGCSLLIDTSDLTETDAAADDRVDGSSQGGDASTASKIVFVTSVTTTGAFGGLSAADALCQLLADNALLPGDYKAWLSDSTGSPSTRFVKSEGRYVLVSGGVIAQNWNNLIDGQIDNPISHDERGNPVFLAGLCQMGDVWSNTGINGELFSAMSSCNDWTGVGISKPGDYLSTSQWTVSGCLLVDCPDRLPFYCFQQ